MRRAPFLPGVVVAALLCGACDSVPSDAVKRCEASQVVPTAVATDLLFVIDDSGSMSEEQANLAANLAAFIDALAASPVQNRFRVGVTTTSVERFDHATTFASGPASGLPYPAGALVAVAPGAPGELVHDASAYAATGGWGGARVLDQGSPTLVTDFEANVRVGVDGSGKEQPFRAARLALSDRLADANAGFLRPGARLAVVFVTDEDDCSDTVSPFAMSNTDCHSDAVKAADPPVLDRPEDFAAFLLGPVGGERRDVMVGIIAGLDPTTLAPSCSDASLCASTACGTAYDGGDRFVTLAAALGQARVELGSICDQSFATTLQRFAELILPSSMPLSGAPADPRMLVVTVEHAAGAVTVPCTVAVEGTAEAASADAVYGPPRFGAPARLTFQNACTLGLGDRIDVKVVCAG